MEKGVKYDQEKDRWSLLPFVSVREILAVLAYGAGKYPSANNWKNVPEARRRYFEAALRHMWAWWDGETNDQESDRHHLAHAGCCVLFLLWFELQGKRQENEDQEKDKRK